MTEDSPSPLSASAVSSSSHQTYVYQPRSPTDADSQQHQYTLRGLTSDAQVEEWTHFCAFVFRTKKPHPPPASYFARHYFNDPDRDRSLIRVAIDQANETIVSSCRVFRRRIHIGNQVVASVYGIGEVCTSIEHRRRGLASALLHNALNVCCSTTPHPIVLLHAAPSVQPVYAKAAEFRTSRTAWCVVPVDVARLHPPPQEDYHLRRVVFPQDTNELQRLHQLYSENRFLGCIVRSEEYWNEYISKELEGSLWLLTTSTGEPSTIQAWMSLRSRGDGRYQLREFGSRSLEHVPQLMTHLLCHCLQQAREHDAGGGSTTNASTIVHCSIPRAVYEEAKLSEADFVTNIDLSEIEEVDYGWMYRCSSENMDDIPTLSQTQTHLIWPSDSF